MPASGVKWKQVRRYFTRRGYELKHSGGDVIIVAPKTNPAKRRARAPVRIGHNFIKTNSQLLDVHLDRIKAAFGVSCEHILNDIDPA